MSFNTVVGLLKYIYVRINYSTFLKYAILFINLFLISHSLVVIHGFLCFFFYGLLIFYLFVYFGCCSSIVCGGFFFWEHFLNSHTKEKGDDFHLVNAV